ncbi:MAG TPA: hypothetical protein VHO01_17150 [Jatrophihabitans sp.]|nr:hypothetical protein [Jatrophihabitans sp.]
MSALSDYLIEHLPQGWNKPRLVDALDGRLDRATVYKYLAGKHPARPSESVLQAFAEVLPQASVVELRAAAGQAAGVEEPWIPPAEANRLTLAQRQALEAFIKATVASNDAVARELERAEAERELVELDLPELPVPVGAGGDDLSDSEQLEVQSYLEQLYASGRRDLADRVAASLVINSASATASRSSNT